MYKCKECGCEYEKKPDYCNCGNDEFDEFIAKQNATEIKTEESSISYSMPVEKKYYTQKQQIEHKLKTDPLSIIIFFLCLVLSLFIIFFAWNPTEKETTEIKINETQINIPSINSLWNDTLPVDIKKQDNKTKEVNSNIPKLVSIPKPAVTNNTKKQTTSSVISSKKKNITDTQNVSTKKSDDILKKKAEQDRIAAEEAQIKKLKAEQAKKAEEAAKKASKQEFITYKANIRNTIGRKIDFTKVIGDGDCIVSFQIDQNGKFINRSFAKQSSNITLNNAVYNAVMATPTFTPPPSAYNNQFLYLNIKFYNGNFEISLSE